MTCRWLNELPKEVREAAGPGCACCLFWPPAEAARRRSIGTSEGLWQRVKGLPLIHYVDLAAKVPSNVKEKKNVGVEFTFYAFQQSSRTLPEAAVRSPVINGKD